MVGSGKIINRHARRVIATRRFNREVNLLPTLTFEQLAHKIHAYILPICFSLILSLNIKAEDWVTLARPVSRCWVAEPCRAIHRLARTNRLTRSKTGHQAWFHGTIHIQCLTRMSRCHSPIFVHGRQYRVFTIEWERTLRCTTAEISFLCQFTRCIHISIRYLSPWQMRIVVVIKINATQHLIFIFNTGLSDDCLCRWTTFLHIHKLHLKFGNQQRLRVCRCSCQTIPMLHLLLAHGVVITSDYQIVQLSGICRGIFLCKIGLSLIIPHLSCPREC